MSPSKSAYLIGTAALLLSSWALGAALPPLAGFGPNPQLPAPHEGWLPTINIAPAKGWPANAKPIAASDLTVAAFAQGLTHPRWLYVLPNGDVLVAETNGPGEPVRGLKSLAFNIVQKRAGGGVESPNRITLLRDADGNGIAETKTVFLQGLHSPFGMTLVGNDLYVADTDAVLRFPYRAGETSITAPGTKLIDLPAGPIDHHWTKNIIASRDGSKLYATVGSNSNVGENGLDQEEGRAAIWEIDRTTGKARIFATGLRNPNGMGWEPQTGALWTAVRDGAFYGWPYSYYGQHVDSRVKPQRPDLVARATVPDYALGAHTGSLGLAFSEGGLLPARYKSGVFIGQHGSWNRSVPNGYKVIFVPFANGRPNGNPEDVLTGFLDKDGNALGRPVGVALDHSGALLVADDVGNTVWRVAPPGPSVANLQKPEQ